MGAKTAIHTFQKGMVKDLEKSLVSNESYLDAHNIRLITSTGESSGGLENVEGNNNLHNSHSAGSVNQGHSYIVVQGTVTYDSVVYSLGQVFMVGASPTVITGTGYVIDINEIMPANMYIVGSTFIRDTLVLFITDNTSASPSAGRSLIVKMSIDKASEVITSYSVLYDDSLNNSTGYLKFSRANDIKAVGTYETPTVQKIYWCDGYNNVRYANIAEYMTTDGAAFNGSTNDYFSVDLFEFIPEVTLTKPILDRLSTGNIKAGVVQYAFQYFRNHGSETVFSPLSDVINITEENDYATADIYYRGALKASNSGKSVSIAITTSDSDKFDHIRIVRLHYGTVNAVPTIDIVGEVSITPTTTSISFLDNGNSTLGTITLDQFNLGETELFSAKDLAIKDNRLFAANIKKEEFSIGDWDARAVRFDSTRAAFVEDSVEGNESLSYTFSDWADYVENHDGINSFNNPAFDGNAGYQFKFQGDGTTLGAEGPNIKIGFTTDTMVIDEGSSTQSYGVGTESTSDNKSYTSFTSPYMAGRRSWQRDEVYRLFIVFFDAHGRSSNAKWICDLRMPSLHDSGYHLLSAANGANTETTALYPTVRLNSMPTGAVAAQLLRVERGGADRSILTQAFVIPMNSSGTSYPLTIGNNINTLSIVKLVSPEINITKNISEGSNDYLEYVTNFTESTLADGTKITYHKCKTSNLVAYSANCKSTVSSVAYQVPRSETDTFSFNSTTCINYNGTTNAYGCSGMFVAHSNPVNWTAVGTNYVVANYKRDVHSSRYGGETYEARDNNVAIPASGLLTQINTTYTAWNGDTFINWFDVSTQVVDLTQATGASTNETLYIPLESSINCDLRSDESMHRAVFKDLGTYSHLMQEVAGKWTNTSGLTYDQGMSLYQYNTVYSQDSTAKFYVNIPADVSTDTDFDCMVKVSKAKINGEKQDSWTTFPINDFIEVGTKHGPVSTIKCVNDKLLFWQDTAFGVLSVNDRSLVQDSNGAAIVLGTGGVLDRYDYISELVGASDSNHVTDSPMGVYWLNTKDKSVYRFSNSLENISKSRQMQSWFEQRLSASRLQNEIIRSAYDKRYDQILISFYNTSLVDGITLAYDEGINAFTSFYDYYTYKFIPITEGLLSISHIQGVDMPFYHNSLIKERCAFHSYIPGGRAAETTYLHDSTIKVLFNDEYPATKVFDNIFMVATTTKNDIELYNVTFDSIRCYNNYQNTDYCDLVYGTNLERDEREWTTFVPRNAVNKDYDTNPDVFDPSNIDKSRTFRERMRDKYMITDFVFTNTDNRRIVAPYVTVKYRVSYR